MKTRMPENRIALAARTRRRTKRLNRSQAPGGASGFKRILVPLDFSAGSEGALRQAATLAALHQARVLPLHVTPPICFTADCGYGPVERTLPDETALRRKTARLEKLVRRIIPKEAAAAIRVCCGQPGEQILKAAQEWRADLILLFAHDRAGLKSAAPTHTVEQLVRLACCPVLLLPPPGRRTQRGLPR